MGPGEDCGSGKFPMLKRYGGTMPVSIAGKAVFRNRRVCAIVLESGVLPLDI